MSMEDRVSKHPLARYGKVLGVCALAGGAGGGVAGVVTATMSDRGWLSAGLVAGAVALAMGAGLWASLKWWRGLDEAAQEAHKWAWWWGSTVGLAVAGVALMTVFYGMGPQGEASVKVTLGVGAAVVALCQFAGYGVAWALWWLRRR